MFRFDGGGSSRVGGGGGMGGGDWTVSILIKCRDLLIADLSLHLFAVERSERRRGLAHPRPLLGDASSRL